MDIRDFIAVLFTPEELAGAKLILRGSEPGKHGRIIELLRPRLALINEQTGQENSLPYLAYLLEYQCVKESGNGEE